MRRRARARAWAWARRRQPRASARSAAWREICCRCSAKSATHDAPPSAEVLSAYPSAWKTWLGVRVSVEDRLLARVVVPLVPSHRLGRADAVGAAEQQRTDRARPAVPPSAVDVQHAARGEALQQVVDQLAHEIIGRHLLVDNRQAAEPG
eukprot:scaffold24291_cov69-Phaeocystis_antarctica.AAC.1